MGGMRRGGILSTMMMRQDDASGERPPPMRAEGGDGRSTRTAEEERESFASRHLSSFPPAFLSVFHDSLLPPLGNGRQGRTTILLLLPFFLA